MSDFAPPIAFHFAVGFVGDQDVAFTCQEVSGLESTTAVDTVVEGGENRFVHQLPKSVPHPNLKLKRGLTTHGSQITAWCRSVLEHDLATPIQPKDLTVTLVDSAGDPKAQWQITKAYPVKWSVDSFDAMRNELAIESIELAYARLSRAL